MFPLRQDVILAAKLAATVMGILGSLALVSYLLSLR